MRKMFLRVGAVIMTTVGLVLVSQTAAIAGVVLTGAD